MKVLFVVLNYYPSVGGTQIFFQNIAEQFANRYHDNVEVFTTNSYFGPNKIEFKKIEKKSEVINNVKIVRFPFRRLHKPFFSTAKKIAARLFNTQSSYINARLAGPWSPSLNKAIAKTDADIIIASSSAYMYMQYPLNRHKFKNPKPFIFQGAFHFKDNFPPEDLSPLTLNAMKAADIYWSNTSFESGIVNALGVKKEKIKLIATGIDPDEFKNADKYFFRTHFKMQQNEILLVCLGRIDAFKGIDVFMQSLYQLNLTFQNFKAVVAGNNFGFLDNLKTIRSGFPEELKNKIFFLENISHTEKVNLCAAMDMLVLPSVNESFGMVFLEAWSCKKPVIGADIGAIATVISDKKDGLLFEKDNPQSLASQMLKLAEDKDLREQMGVRGYRKVMDNYTWTKVADNCRETCFDAIRFFKEDNRIDRCSQTNGRK
jgi:glycosyltransferase involved in cell wall biosynthesis